MIRYASISERGKRSDNEDAFKIAHIHDNQLMAIVCDGLGGHPMGEVASALIAESMCRYYNEHRQATDIPQMIIDACKTGMDNLNARADVLNHVNMGTTMVQAVISGNILTIAHIGDSRCYVVRKNGGLIHQTKDHTKLIYGRDVLDRCFIAYNDNAATPDIVQIEIKTGDRILLCSDGLYKSIVPEILTARMTDDKSPEEILDVFAFLCEKNSDDNYTGILISIE